MNQSKPKMDIEDMNEGEKEHIISVETACVENNQVLAMSVKRRDVERCIDLIRQYGLLTLPVVGELADGAQILLSGECEFLALREIGVKKVGATRVVLETRSEGEKVALLLSSLQKCPNALSEGFLITQLINTGNYTQTQLSKMLGKSVSWVNKRISLVTRLNPAVKELVKQGQLCPQSAAEISRLPAQAQDSFSLAAVAENLSKSSVETLVAAFNAPSSPDWVKEQIAANPAKALLILSGAPVVQAIRSKGDAAKPAAALTWKDRMDVLQRHLAGFVKEVYSMSEKDPGMQMLNDLRNDMTALILLIDQKLSFSLGKKEAPCYGN